MGLHYGFHINRFLTETTGSILGMVGARQTIAIQKQYLKDSKHKIPLLFMTDVIHGYRTIFPSPLGLACSWSPELIEQTAAVAAKEASVSGVHLTFSPMADLVRDCRWGRVVESTGEDPYLNSLYASAFVRGYQGDDVSAPYKIASCVKHFAGYGAAESGKDYNTTDISEYQLRNFYFPAFKAAIDSGCKMVMPGFNALNGIPCTANPWLIQDILREEWKFTDPVITDCTATYELTAHGLCASNKEAAQAAINTGMDIEMVSTTFFEEWENLAAEGKVSMQTIDAAVERILRLKDELGLFENPYKDADPAAEEQIHLCKEHRALAREATAKSVVLLKNEHHVLPLHKNEKIALIGPYADNKNLLDIWKCQGKEEECVTLLEGLRDRIQVFYAEGCALEENPAISYEEVHTVDRDTSCDAACLNSYDAAVSDCDKIILALGEPASWSGEAGSRAHITLPKKQLELLKRLSASGKPVITVIFSGRPLELSEAAAASTALLQAWLPGTEGGNGIADVLTGTSLPEGRLTISFPRTVGQLPLYYNALPTGRPKKSDSITERFSSGYIDELNSPLYPFGYGLTYTTFQYSGIRLSDKVIKEGGTIEAAITLTNTGTFPGTETVQLYLRDLAGAYSRPVKMLKGFQKVFLSPGESRTVDFTISSEMLQYDIPGHGMTLEPGDFQLFIGVDSTTANLAEFTLVKTRES